jgi:peptidoglycan L-alanyl-D-glutamate endopeptidase CwlK
MPRFSETSRRRLLTCDSRLIAVCSDAIQYFDFSVISGHRTIEEQNKLYEIGRRGRPGEKIVTNLRGGMSIHNSYPSRAADLAPWLPGHGVAWHDETLFHELYGVMLVCAMKRGIDLEWGGKWRTFVDRPHFQVPPQD